MTRFLRKLPIVLLVTSVAFADVVSQTSLELRIQEKITAIVRPVDANAIIVTNVTFKNVDINLPGMGTSLHEVFGPGRSDQLVTEEINTVNIRVISTLNPFPESLKSLIENSVGLDKKKTKFSFEKMDGGLQKIIDSRSTNTTKILSELTNFNKKTLWYLVITVLGVYIAVTSLTLIFSSRRAKRGRRFWEATLDRVSQNLGTNPERVATPLPTLARDPVNPLLSSPSGQSRDQLQELSAISVRALLSDAYWCEADGYAAWIWSSLSTPQREDVIKSWIPALEYSSYLTKVAPEPQADHLNSCYLRPLDFSLVSQADLTAWIRKYPSAWSLVSPMRQGTLKLTLQEKMTFACYQGALVIPEAPAPSAKPRLLSKAVEVGEISDLDELNLFANPEVVPQAMRADVWTLVWMAILPEQQMKDLIDEVSAQNLAEAWIAAAPVLQKLEAALPEKKRKLLHGYLKVTRPSRRSEAMRFLTARALEIADENEASVKGEDAQAV